MNEWSGIIISCAGRESSSPAYEVTVISARVLISQTDRNWFRATSGQTALWMYGRMASGSSGVTGQPIVQCVSVARSVSFAEETRHIHGTLRKKSLCSAIGILLMNYNKMTERRAEAKIYVQCVLLCGIV